MRQEEVDAIAATLYKSALSEAKALIGPPLLNPEEGLASDLAVHLRGVVSKSKGVLSFKLRDSSQEWYFMEQKREYYRGETINGKPHGRGQYLYRNGLKYYGFWDNGAKHGPAGPGLPFDGKVKYSHQTYGLYEGQFSNSMRNGEGSFSFCNGEVFTGTWFNNHKKYGHYFFNNGDIYIGGFEKGKMEGEGSYHFKDKRVLKGLFSGTLVKGTIEKDEVVIFEGVVDLLKGQNEGRLRAGEGVQLEGRFLGGQVVQARIVAGDSSVDVEWSDNMPIC